MINRRGLFAGGLASVVAPLLGGCDRDGVPKFVWQQTHFPKLTVAVETSDGVRSSNSVLMIRWDKAGRGFEYFGEAVAVPLPKGQYLFATLQAKWSEDWPAYLHESVDLGDPSLKGEQYFDRISVDRRVWPLKRRRVTALQDSDNYPLFVRFKSLSDPTSVEIVDPDQLDRAFGKGCKLRNFTVQMTGGPRTYKIDRVLPWLNFVMKERATLIPNPPLLLGEGRAEQHLGLGLLKTYRED